MAIDPSSASSAYRQASQMARAGGGGPEEGGAAQAPGQGFADMVRDAVRDTQELGREAEKTSLQAIAGNASMVDVATAVNNADMALNTLVSVRDKMVEAYQTIARMRI